jgi:hypothetical protein
VFGVEAALERKGSAASGLLLAQTAVSLSTKSRYELKGVTGISSCDYWAAPEQQRVHVLPARLSC